MANKLTGSVAEIGPRGNLISDITAARLAVVPRDENTLVIFGEHETPGLYESEHGQPDTTMVAYIGPDGFLEIEIVGISLAEMLGIRVGETISVRW